jgi:non-specific serine/threonine protein kinase
MNTQSFAELLRRHRLALGLTQDQLAERAGLSGRGISDLERGVKQAPRATTVQLLVRGLGLDEAEAAALLRAAQPRGDRVPDDGRHNLPAPTSSFVGREQELADLLTSLRTIRLLTLTGPGGISKTRLALRVAWEVLGEYPDGVWFVDFAPLGDPALVPQVAVAALGVREQPRQTAQNALLGALGDRRLLLVLDNCEHLVVASAQLIAALLRACPDVRFLATSREPLGIAGETVYRVPPLPIPDPRVAWRPEALLEFPSVQLLLERTAAAATRLPPIADQEHARAVAEICRRVEGLPLALELAAARLPALGTAQVASRLDDAFGLLVGGYRDAPTRQQTLVATLDWSYRLLSAPERRLFARLAVFSGGWTLDAAEGVCAGDGIEAAEVVDLLGRLVAKSLVLAGHESGAVVRYRLLEPIRQYAQQQLAASGEANAIRARHRQWMLELAERVASEFHGGGEARELTLLEAELDNLRLALDWPAADNTGLDLGLRLAGQLFWFWHTRARWQEGRLHLQRLLVRDGKAASPATRADALFGLAQLTWAQGSGDLAEARRLHEEALSIRRGLGDRRAIAYSLQSLSVTIRYQGDVATARRLLDDALDLFEAVDDRVGQARTLNGLGIIARGLGDATRAQQVFQRSLALSREQGDQMGVVTQLGNLGELALVQADLDHAASFACQSLRLGRELRARWGIDECLTVLARVAARRQQARRAARLFGAIQRLREESGADASRSTTDEPDLAGVRARLSRSVFAECWTAGRGLPLEQVITEELEEEESRARHTPHGNDWSALTPREQEVARLVARGFTNRQIASELVVTEATAAKHVENIREKLGLNLRTQVGAWVRDHETAAAPPVS